MRDTDLFQLALGLTLPWHVGEALGEGLCELDVNPLFVMPEGQGVGIGDALMVLDGSYFR